MTRRFAAITFVLSLALTPIASADMMVDLVDINGIDSGWSVALADNIHTGIAVDAVTVDSVRIEVFKEFYHPPVGGRFAANTIRFVQRLSDAKTVGTIEITDEIVINSTGVAWTDYHWEIEGSAAAFSSTDTAASGFDVSPFTTMTWGTDLAGWVTPHSVTLDAEGGTVPAGSVFIPGLIAGRLYIDVDLSGDDAKFSLNQYPTPEPGSLAVVAGGAGLLLVRRRARNRRC